MAPSFYTEDQVLKQLSPACKLRAGKKSPRDIVSTQITGRHPQILRYKKLEERGFGEDKGVGSTRNLFSHPDKTYTG